MYIYIYQWMRAWNMLYHLHPLWACLRWTHPLSKTSDEQELEHKLCENLFVNNDSQLPIVKIVGKSYPPVVVCQFTLVPLGLHETGWWLLMQIPSFWWKFTGFNLWKLCIQMSATWTRRGHSTQVVDQVQWAFWILLVQCLNGEGCILKLSGSCTGQEAYQRISKQLPPKGGKLTRHHLDRALMLHGVLSKFYQSLRKSLH